MTKCSFCSDLVDCYSSVILIPEWKVIFTIDRDHSVALYFTSIDFSFCRPSSFFSLTPTPHLLHKICIVPCQWQNLWKGHGNPIHQLCRNQLCLAINLRTFWLEKDAVCSESWLEEGLLMFGSLSSRRSAALKETTEAMGKIIGNKCYWQHLAELSGVLKGACSLAAHILLSS